MTFLNNITARIDQERRKHALNLWRACGWNIPLVGGSGGGSRIAWIPFHFLPNYRIARPVQFFQKQSGISGPFSLSVETVENALIRRLAGPGHWTISMRIAGDWFVNVKMLIDMNIDGLRFAKFNRRFRFLNLTIRVIVVTFSSNAFFTGRCGMDQVISCTPGGGCLGSWSPLKCLIDASNAWFRINCGFDAQSAISAEKSSKT